MFSLARSEVFGSRQREMSECESGRTQERAGREVKSNPKKSTYFEICVQAAFARCRISSCPSVNC